MSDCSAVGDSIAVGLAAAMHCVPYAKVGRSSGTQAAIMHSVSASLVIISLGSNDPSNPRLLQNLRSVRSKIAGKRVVWIAPFNQQAAASVFKAAAENGDGVVALSGMPSHDHVHPANYHTLARRI